MSIYVNVRWADWRMSNKRLLTAEASDLIDKIHVAALDFTIDYEEYFNRTSLWLLPNGTWFSSYWNSWTRYYCWNVGSYTWYNIILRNDSEWWCVQNWINQKYLEYKFQHRNLATWNLNSKDNSDSNVWLWPVAISPNTWLDILCLISPDWVDRYYFRRVYKTWNNLTGKNDNLYTIQMLRLKWLDAGINQDFNSRWAYDWFIDTRACDYSQWFICSWQTVMTWYKLPSDENDWRVDITSDKVTVNDFRIDIYPNKDPYLATNDTWAVLDPYAKISFTMNMYDKPSNDEITISTTFSFKNSYSRFEIVEYTWYIPEDATWDTI